MRDTDRAIHSLARQQGGAFARWQVLAHGGHDVLINRRCASGAWVRTERGVFVVAGAPRTATTDVWEAWLAVGPHAVRSHECAAEARRLHPVVTGRFVFITRHGDHHRIEDVRVHQLRDLLPHHMSPVDGMPTTTSARTVVDLASVVSLERLKRVVENGVLDRIVSDDDIGRVLHDVARRGKRGVKKLTHVLALRSPGEPVPASKLEQMLLDALRSAGLPDPVPQYPHPGREVPSGWVDFAYVDAKLILEADGRRWHQRVADIERDRDRDNAAGRVGWLTMRFMHERLRSDPDGVGAEIVETLSHRPAA